MTAETILAALARLNLVASVGIVLVLALRPWVLRWLGAGVAYWFWLAVPIAAAASVLPAREALVLIQPTVRLVVEEDLPDGDAAAPALPAAVAEGAATPMALPPVAADLLVAVWLLGAGALLVVSLVTTRRLATDPSIGPALVGVLRPRLVLPTDFATRFDAEERALILAHEDQHRVSAHTLVNALVEIARCACWFNPLAHLAAIRIRTDQELACDAAVIATRPWPARRAYAQALLKAQATPTFVRLGCTWTSRSGKRLGERIEMLGHPSSSRRGALAGASAVAVVGLGLGYAAWAQQPDRIVTQTAARPEAVWTASAQAPAGTLSHELEGQRHDFFIELAQAGHIDLVFFGTTEAEMWWWPNRGRSVWDRAFGSIQAANFGSQGTRPESLLWRMRNGELDGYQAKLIVLQAGANGDIGAELADGYAALIDEIQLRQPNARILLFAPLPRGGTLDTWRPRAQTNAALFRRFVDDETVFYTDIGERFYLPDGSFNGANWSNDFADRGTQTSAYEIWAEELQPWLDRFVR